MAQITWRDVAAPNFSGVADGFSNFSRMLGEGLGSLKGAVGGFDQAKSDIINKQLMLALAQQPNAEASQKAVAAGQIGGLDISSPDFLRRVSSENLASLGPAAMTRLGADQLALREKVTDFDQQAAQDAQAPVLAKAYADLRSADPTARLKASEIIGSMDFTKTGAKFVGDLNTAAQGTQRNAITNASSQFDFGNAQEDRSASEEADAVFSQFLAGAETPEDAKALLFGEGGPAAKMSAAGRTALERRLASQFPGVFGGASAAIAGAAGGGSAPVAGVAGGAAGNPYGIVIGGTAMGLQPDKPITDMTLAEAEAYGKEVLIPRTRGNKQLGLPADKGSSAMGAYQILAGSTLGVYAKKLGLDPSTTKFTPQVQEKIAEEIFKDSKGGNLKAIWTSLPNATPGAYKNKTWAEVRGLIAQGESGASSAQLISEAADANVGTAMRGMQVSDGLEEDLLRTVNDRTPAGTIVDRLIGPEGHFRGTSRGWMIDKVNRVMREANVNAATAEAILVRSIAGTDEDQPINQLIRQVSGGTVNLGGKARLDDRAVNEKIERFKSGGVRREVASTMARNDLSAQVATAQANVARLQAQLTQTKKEVIRRPNLAPMVAFREAELEAAKAQLGQLSQAALSPGSTPATNKPAVQVPRPVAQTSGGRVSQLFAKYLDGKETD